MDFFKGLREATECGFVRWERTGQEIETGWEKRKTRGHIATFGEFTIETMVDTKKVKGFLGTKVKECYAMKIEKGTKKIVFTSDPNIIPGKKDEHIEFELHALNWRIEEWDLVASLNSEIKKMFHKPE